MNGPSKDRIPIGCQADYLFYYYTTFSNNNNQMKLLRNLKLICFTWLGLKFIKYTVIFNFSTKWSILLHYRPLLNFETTCKIWNLHCTEMRFASFLSGGFAPMEVTVSDESEPSWLEPELELKDFQLGSARLVTFFPSAWNQKSAENEPKFWFWFFFFNYVAKS